MMMDKLKNIRLVLLDVDGVLTSGDIIYSDSGEQIKIFDVKDGLGVRLLHESGIRVGIVTGRQGRALRHRCKNLGIDMVFDGVWQKGGVLDEIVERTGLPPESMAFIGDDLPDLSIMKKVGLAVAVADADGLVRKGAHITTSAPGGRGAVREIAETILKAQGRWDELIRRLFNV